MTAPVFLGAPAELASLDAGDRYLLTGDEGRHARVVQRREVGEAIDLVDGRGLRLRCVVSGLPDGSGGKPQSLELEVTARVVEPAPTPEITLVQALAKGDHSEMAITTAVETGVNAVVPWQADRSIVIWRGDRAEKSRAKWEAAVTAAAKQSRRAYIPTVEPPVNTAQLVNLVKETVADQGVALVLDAAGAISLEAAKLPVNGKILVIVGPEGGISDTELAALNAAGANSVRLGQYIMRSSTAGPVAIAVIAMKLGRWIP